MKKQLTLKGTVTWLQMVSMRNKATGEFNFQMDGNVNNTLNTLYTFRKEVKQFNWVVPNLSEADKAFIDDLNKTVYDGRINVVEVEDLYGANAGEHKQKYHDYFSQTEFSLDNLESYLESSDIIVCDFPADLDNTGSYAGVEVKYHWCITKMSEDDNGPGTKFFEQEKEYAMNDNTEGVYLFSDQQYDYIKSVYSKYAPVFRRTEVFHPDFMSMTQKRVIDTAYEGTGNEATLQLMSAIEEWDGQVLLWPHRICDSRYKLEERLDKKFKDNTLIVFTNPTGLLFTSEHISNLVVKMNDIAATQKVAAIVMADMPEDENMPNLPEAKPDKRFLYMWALTQPNVHIEHYEHDMHTGVVEQFSLLPKGNVKLFSDQLNEETVQSMIATAV